MRMGFQKRLLFGVLRTGCRTRNFAPNKWSVCRKQQLGSSLNYFSMCRGWQESQLELKSSSGATVARIERFQKLLKAEGVDAAMIKTESSFTYFAGVKWLRPGLIIPAEGEPVAYIPKHEVEAFVEASCGR